MHGQILRKRRGKNELIKFEIEMQARVLIRPKSQGTRTSYQLTNRRGQEEVFETLYLDSLRREQKLKTIREKVRNLKK